MNRKNILHISKILLLFLSISYLIDKVVYFGLRKLENEVFTGQSVGKFNHYLAIKDSLDLVVFGSSRANHHVNPSLITKKGYNMGFDGQKIAFSAAILKLLSKNKQTILFHIDPENAVDNSYSAEDLSSLRVLYNKNEIIKEEIDKYSKINPLQKFYWSISYNGIVFGIIKNYLTPKYEHNSYNGFDPLPVNEIQMNQNYETIEKTIDEECKITLLKLNPVYQSYLADIREFCFMNDKKIIFFTSPKLFDKCKSDNLFVRHEMKKMNLNYIDFSDIFNSASDLSNWKDATHLSDKGAKNFTNQISRTIFGYELE